MLVECPKCESSYQVADDFEGKTLKCTGCQTRFRARLNRAAIKEHNLNKPEEGNWPTKAPTLNEFKKQTENPSNLPMILGAILGVGLFVALIVSLAYVYLANSQENRDNLRNGDLGSEVQSVE